MASRRKVGFQMEAEDNTARGVRSVERRFKKLGRGIVASFGGNLLANAVTGIFRELSRGVEGFRRVVDNVISSRAAAAFDRSAESARRFAGATDEAIRISRRYREIQIQIGAAIATAARNTASFKERITVALTDKVINDWDEFKSDVLAVAKGFLALNTPAEQAALLLERVGTRSTGAAKALAQTTTEAGKLAVELAKLDAQGRDAIKTGEESLRVMREAQTMRERAVSDLEAVVQLEKDLWEEQNRQRTGADRGENIERRDPGTSNLQPTTRAQQLLKDIQRQQGLQALDRTQRRARGEDARTGTQALEDLIRESNRLLKKIEQRRAAQFAA